MLIFLGSIIDIIIEIRNLKVKNPDYGWGGLCFGIPLLLSALSAAEWIGWYWVWKFLFSLFLGSLGVSHFAVVRFVSSSVFLLPVLIIIHFVFSWKIDKKFEKLEGEKKKETEETKENKEYLELEKRLREEKMKAISLKDGYQFASVPSRIFAERSDSPGSYCCPYCYAEVSSDVSSMCGNCGKSLGIENEGNSVMQESSSTFGKEVQPSEIQNNGIQNNETKNGEVSVEEKNPGNNKKVYVGIGVGVAALVAVLGVIFIINKEPSRRTSVSGVNVDSESQSNNHEILEMKFSEASKEEPPTTPQPKSNGIVKGTILRSVANLRLRAEENTDSAIITTMNKHTKVKIIGIGRVDESDGIISNWFLVEVLPGGKDRDLNRIPSGTKGWCFGGFLEPCPDDD